MVPNRARLTRLSPVRPTMIAVAEKSRASSRSVSTGSPCRTTGVTSHAASAADSTAGSMIWVVAA